MRELQLFLDSKSKYPGLYHDGLEAQINVAEDHGEKKDNGFTDGREYWYNYRLQGKGVPSYDIANHAAAIGVTGWNYKTKKSEFVGFDFDSITGHKKGLTEQQLNEVIEQAKKVNWITIRRSTSGNGLHLYIHLDPHVDTKDRMEHIKLSEFLLSQLSALVSFDFKSVIDKAGSILWIWSRKGNKPKSFQLLQKGVPYSSVPANWRDTELKKEVKKISFNVKHTRLSDGQKELIHWFNRQSEPGPNGEPPRGALWWWDTELNMLVCHTADLKRAHTELNLRGIYETKSTGKECPNDQNCFCFPIRNDAWIVRRHGQGVVESKTWAKDKAGWTYCFFNKTPNLEDLARAFDGQLSSKEQYVFSGSQIQQVLGYIALERVEIPESLRSRQFRLKRLKNSRLSICCDRTSGEPDIPTWVNESKRYERVVNIAVEQKEVTAPDELIRHVVADDRMVGWYLKTKDRWVEQDLHNIRNALQAMGHQGPMINEIFGQCVLNPWTLVNYPFESEYPGDREWNKFSPRLLFDPAPGDFPTWNLIFNHIGKNLDIKDNLWCKLYGVGSGADYFKLWVAALFQYPQEPLPYLFLYGDQLSGKSTLFEALGLLTERGVVNGGTALESNDGFNRELAGAILCYIDELDLSRSKKAYTRIKEWTTAKNLSIHEKGKTPVPLPNTTHWIHVANNVGYCPIDLGDTRITMVKVDVPKIVLTKSDMFAQLQEQAPAFLHHILHEIEIPPAKDRLRIPVIETLDKQDEQYSQANDVVQFILQEGKQVAGHCVPFAEFCSKFLLWTKNPHYWNNKRKISSSIPMTKDMPLKGRGTNNILFLGNFSFDKNAEPKDFVWFLEGQYLRKQTL